METGAVQDLYTFSHPITPHAIITLPQPDRYQELLLCFDSEFEAGIIALYIIYPCMTCYLSMTIDSKNHYSQ